MPADGRLGQPEFPRRRRQRAEPQDAEEGTVEVPTDVIHFCMDAKGNLSISYMRVRRDSPAIETRSSGRTIAMSERSNSNLKPVALVLGATGGIGGHMARGLAARGWTV